MGGEWFLGEDPGYGRGYAFDYPAGGATTAVTATLPAATEPGFRRYSIRVRDARGIWSQTYSTLLAVLRDYPVNELAALEWFWDEDPGYGSGNHVPLSGDTARIALQLDIADLAPGFHKFNVRAMTQDGIWGPTFWRGTLLRAEAEAKIERIVYTYWEDVPIATFRYELQEPAHYLDLTFVPQTEGLAEGQSYRFCAGVDRTDGKQSYRTCRSFTFQDIANSVSEPAVPELTLFPNPNRGTFTVESPSLASSGGVFELFDVAGKSVLRRVVRPGSSATLEVSTGAAAPGVYFAVLESAGRVRVSKVVVGK